MNRFAALCSLLALISLSGAAFAGSEYDHVQAALAPFVQQVGPINPDDIARLKNVFANREAVAAAPARGVTAPVAFTIRGTGNATGTAAGACFDTCSASAHHCSCWTIAGTANVTGLGTANFSEALSVNDDDCANTGDNAICCPGDGVAAFTKGANTVAMVTQGQFCFASIEGQPVNTVAVHMNYTILPGSGKFSKSGGSGVIEKSIEVKTGSPLWESATGMIQVKAP